jgi:hypothetical protein
MDLTIIKKRVFKFTFPLVSSLLFFYSLTQVEAKEEKNTKVTIEQIKIKQIASEEILKKIAQNEIEKSWLNASIVSIKKDTSDSNWYIVFENNENQNLRKKELNISINSNGEILNTKII